MRGNKYGRARKARWGEKGNPYKTGWRGSGMEVRGVSRGCEKNRRRKGRKNKGTRGKGGKNETMGEIKKKNHPWWGTKGCPE